MKRIYLKGKYSYLFCIVDDDDYEELSKYNWFYNNCGYAIKNKTGDSPRQYMHRFVMGAVSGQIVDHINQDTYDNRKENLRFVTKSINARNSKKRLKVSSSGYTGVYWSKVKDKWSARISIDGKEISLGYHSNLDDAVSARREAETLYAIT